MIKIFVIGDPHFKIGTLQRSQVMIQEIIEQLDKTNPDLIVCLGDVLDRFANIRQEALSQSIDFFNLLRSYAPTYILIGNHDRPNNSVYLTDEHPFNAVKYWEESEHYHPIYIIDTPRMESIQGLDIVFVPYVPNGRFVEALDTLDKDWKNSRIIFAHQDFYGAMYNNQKSDTGDHWEKNYPIVFSGHIHDYQELTSNIIYIGAPMQHAFNESPQKSIHLIQLDASSISHERLFINSPIYWTFKIPVSDVKDFIPPKLPKYSDMKLVIEGTFSEIKGLNKLSKIKEWSKQGIKIQPSVLNEKKSFINPVKKSLNKSFIQYFTESLSDNIDLLSTLNSLIE